MRARNQIVRRMEPANGRRSALANVGFRLDLFGPRTRDGDIARRPLLQQQLGRLDDGFGVKSRAHRAAVQRVGDRHQRHALVMRHVRAHDGDALAFGHARRRIVQRFVPAEMTEAACCEQPREVLRRGFRIDHRRQRRRVWCDHRVLAQPALQPESGHAEVRVLIGELEVARVVCGLRDSPRHPKLGAVLHLPAHHQPIGLLEQAADRRAHHQRRHQVLEHRARP